MDCSHVREHLSDYIDESLETKTKALVEGHLSACKDCREEVASLRMLIDDLGSMEAVAPPKDFLNQFHKRMERRSRFSKILDTLSIPMQVKLPMKLAGAVVMAVLVFAIYQIQEDEYGTKIVPIVQEPTESESSPPRMAKAPLANGTQEEVLDTEIVREKAKPKSQTVQVIAEETEAKRLTENGVKDFAQVETRADHASREGTPIELSSRKVATSVQESTQSKSSPPGLAKASLETGMQGEADNTGVVKEWMKPKPQAVQQVAEKDEAISLPDNAVKRITHMGTKADHPLRKGGLIELSLVIDRVQSHRAFESTSDMEASRRAQETEMKKTLTTGEVVPTIQLEREKSIEHLLPRLREVIENVGGEVVSVEYEEETHIPDSVLVEIPAEQVGIFQNNLQALGELHGAPISPTGEDEEIIPIRIKLLTP